MTFMRYEYVVRAIRGFIVILVNMVGAARARAVLVGLIDELCTE